MNSIVENMGKVMVGQDGAAKLMVVALAAGGHVLIEDVPGIGHNRVFHVQSENLRI